MPKTIVWGGVIIVGLVIISGIFIGGLLLSNNNTEPISVDIVTKSVKSCPNNFAWFIANISSKTQQKIPEIEIITNITIKTYHKIWSLSTPSVLEVFLHPNNTHTGQTIELKVKIGQVADFAYLKVLDWEDSEQKQAFERMVPFISHFSQKKPDFNINNSTSWESTCNDAGLLVVEHYLFRSENWELELSWHVMVPPHDWVKVYLRPRSQIIPIWGGMIESWNNSSHLVIETDPPDQVFRSQ